MTRVISISSHKGGVGKTTTVASIGAGLAKKGKKVLLIDIDPQANLTVSLGAEGSDDTIYEAFKGDAILYPINVKKNLDIVPSKLEFRNIEKELEKDIVPELILKKLIDPIRDEYDYLVIVCPHSFGFYAINSFVASDEVMIPIQPHYLAVDGLSQILEIVNKIKKDFNRDIQITGIIVTMFDRRKVLHKEVLDIIVTYFQDRVFNTRIRENITLAEAPGTGLDIFRFSEGSIGAYDYLKLCEEILKMEKKIGAGQI